MNEVLEALDLIKQAEALLSQARVRIEAHTGQEPTDHPYMDIKTADRVHRLGEVADRHLKFIEEHGSMTRKDSLAIRRELFGDKIQSTANQFGERDSNALFWRDSDNKTPKDEDPVLMLPEGVRLAQLWRATQR